VNTLHTDTVLTPPKRLRLPTERYCARQHHELLDSNGHATDHVYWDEAGEPGCLSCAAHDLHAIHALLRHHRKSTEHCQRSHPVNLETHGLRWGQDGPEAYCRDCQDAQVVKAQATPILLHPSAARPRVLLEQPPIPQKMKRGLKVVMRGDGTVAGLHHEQVFGNVVPLSPDVPRGRQRNYERRARPYTGAPTSYKGSEIIKNSRSGVCHACSKAFRTGEEVSVDHFVPVRALPSLSLDSRNMRVSHPGCNSRMADFMPTVEEAQRAGMAHMAPLIRTLSPLNVRYRVSATPVSVGVAGEKQVHFSLPHFDQHSESEFLPDGRRHPAVTKYLDAVERVHGPIAGFDRSKDRLFDPTTKQLHPAVKQHLIESLPEDFRPHLRLLKGRGVWLRVKAARAVVKGAGLRVSH
jgi:hypothetical protein